MNILFLVWRTQKLPSFRTPKSYHNPGNNVCLLPNVIRVLASLEEEGGKMWRNFTHIRQLGRHRIWLGTIESTKWPICLAEAVTWVVLWGLLGFPFCKEILRQIYLIWAKEWMSKISTHAESHKIMRLFFWEQILWFIFSIFRSYLTVLLLIFVLEKSTFCITFHYFNKIKYIINVWFVYAVINYWKTYHLR